MAKSWPTRPTAPAGHKRLAVALALIPSDDARLGDVERTIVHTAQPPDANPRSRLPTGLGLVRLYALHASNRFPRGQDVGSSGRLGNGAKASAGQRWGTSGAKIGHAPRTWALAEAAVLCLRDHPAAQHYLARLEKKPDNGHAWPGLAQQVARAVYDRLQPQGACAREQGFPRSGRRADEPGASLDTEGMTLHEALATASSTASLHAKAPRGHETLSPAPLRGQPLSLLCDAVLVAHGLRVRLLTRV